MPSGTSSGNPTPKPRTAAFGFTFQLELNGGGTGANPKVYDPFTPANDFLRGFTDDNVAGVVQLWPSDPGDNAPPPITPAPSRQYDANISPNNIRLSQVSLQSVGASYGIRSTPTQESLPTSFNFNRDVNAGVGNVDAIVGDMTGLRLITVSLLSPNVNNELLASEGAILINGSILLTAEKPRISLALNNLGAVTVVNLSGLAGGRPVVAFVGVHCEINL